MTLDEYVSSVTELIDTCWDVNRSSSADTLRVSARINRYMLGCKLKRIPVRCNHISELIDTCWDVN